MKKGAAKMQAIRTKYLGPTNFRGARVKATAQAGSVTIHWDDSLDVDANHDAAAVALMERYGWTGSMVAGGSPDGCGNVYVFTSGNMVKR
jgi:hypothetical protein